MIVHALQEGQGAKPLLLVPLFGRSASRLRNVMRFKIGGTLAETIDVVGSLQPNWYIVNTHTVESYRLIL
jgi:hypothetical protein